MDRELPFVEHLEELRRRVLLALLSLLIATLISVPFSPFVLKILKLPAGATIGKLAFFSPEEALIIFMRISFSCGLFIASPFIIYQLWLFVAPAIGETFKKRVVYFVLSCSGAFILGGIFAYFIFLPNTLHFLLSLGSDDLVPVLSAGRYVSFVLAIIVGCGFVFQMPVLVFLLTLLGVVNHRLLRKNFKFALVGILVIAAVITPTTDLFNMMMMALPMILLYEISIWISFFVKPVKVIVKKEEKRYGN
jgi:sec-independent protein translocase protein TatC